jgi:hypothetical protein
MSEEPKRAPKTYGKTGFLVRGKLRAGTHSLPTPTVEGERRTKKEAVIGILQGLDPPVLTRKPDRLYAAYIAECSRLHISENERADIRTVVRYRDELTQKKVGNKV